MKITRTEICPLTFRVVCTDGQTEVTFALALLHGCRPLMFQTLIGWLAGVGQTLDRTHLLTQTTLGRTLNHKNTIHTQIQLNLQLVWLFGKYTFWLTFIIRVRGLIQLLFLFM